MISRPSKNTIADCPGATGGFYCENLTARLLWDSSTFHLFLGNSLLQGSCTSFRIEAEASSLPSVMGDRSVQVRGYGPLGSSGGQSDDSEDDLDVIEMTPRNVKKPQAKGAPLYSPTNGNLSMTTQHGLAKPPQHGGLSKPPKALLPPGSRPVAPLNLHSEPEEPGSSKTGHARRHSRTLDADPSLASDLTRDPSGKSDPLGVARRQPGFLGRFVSGLSIALASDSSPETSPDNSPTGDGFQSPTPSQPTVPQIQKPLRYGENERLRKKPLFMGTSDPEAVEFAKFLKDDGDAMRIPVLCMSEYGRGDYARDLWVLPHNSMKRELFDMYEMVSVLRLRYLSLTWGDMYAFRQWWRMFAFFWELYLSIERSFLEPLVDITCEIDGRRDEIRKKVEPMRDDREWIDLKFEEVTSYLEEFEAIPRGRAFSLICKTTDALGFKILGYFNTQERLLPPLIEVYHPSGIKAEVEAKMLNLLRATTLVDESIVHFIRWMEVGKERDAWLSTNLWWGERSTLKRMYRSYASGHGGAVEMFRSKLGRSI